MFISVFLMRRLFKAGFIRREGEIESSKIKKVHQKSISLWSFLNKKYLQYVYSSQVLSIIHPEKRSCPPYITSMATLLLIWISSQVTPWPLYSCADRGPDFGGNDLVITNNAVDSYTICGVSYSLPPGYSESQSVTPCSFFADGSSYKFNPTDVEVFYETTT